MRDIEFHIGLDDKALYACRLVRKACRAGQRVVLTGAPDQLAHLDGLLWTFEQTEFIPHVRLRRGERTPALMARTPVWLAEQAADALPAQVLINLGPSVPDGWARFERVIELLGQELDDLQAGRARWRAYKADGHLPRDVRAQAQAQAAPHNG